MASSSFFFFWMFCLNSVRAKTLSCIIGETGFVLLEISGFSIKCVTVHYSIYRNHVAECFGDFIISVYIVKTVWSPRLERDTHYLIQSTVVENSAQTAMSHAEQPLILKYFIRTVLWDFVHHKEFYGWNIYAPFLSWLLMLDYSSMYSCTCILKEELKRAVN